MAQPNVVENPSGIARPMSGARMIKKTHRRFTVIEGDSGWRTPVADMVRQRFPVIHRSPEFDRDPMRAAPRKNRSWITAVLALMAALWIISASHVEIYLVPHSSQMAGPSNDGEATSVSYFPAQFPQVTHWDTSEPIATF
jgi:hypothetical protein